MSADKEPRAQTYDPGFSYDNPPDAWPEQGTEFGNLVNYLRAATNCAAITVHTIAEGEEHATYYGKGDFVDGGALSEIRANGFYVSLAGCGDTPSETNYRSWVAGQQGGLHQPYIEFRRAD